MAPRSGAAAGEGHGPGLAPAPHARDARMDTSPSNQQLFDLVRLWCAVNYPNEQPEAVVIRWRDAGRRPLQLPLPLYAGGAAGQDGAKAFEPTPFQLGI